MNDYIAEVKGKLLLYAVFNPFYQSLNGHSFIQSKLQQGSEAEQVILLLTFQACVFLCNFQAVTSMHRCKERLYF